MAEYINFRPVGIPDLTSGARLIIDAGSKANPMAAFANIGTALGNFQDSRIKDFDYQQAIANAQQNLINQQRQLDPEIWLSDPANAAKYEQLRTLASQGLEQSNQAREQLRALGLAPHVFSTLDDTLKYLEKGDASRKNVAEVNQANAAAAHNYALTDKAKYELSIAKQLQEAYEKRDQFNSTRDWIEAYPIVRSSPELLVKQYEVESKGRQAQAEENKEYWQDWVNNQGSQRKLIESADTNGIGIDVAPQYHPSQWQQVQAEYARDQEKGRNLARQFLGSKAKRMSNTEIDSFIQGKNAETGLTGVDKAYLEDAKAQAKNLYESYEKALEDAGVAAIRPDYLRTKHGKLYDKNSGFIQREAGDLLREAGYNNPSEELKRLAEDVVWDRARALAETSKKKNILDGNISFEGNLTIDKNGLKEILDSRVAQYEKIKEAHKFFQTPGTSVRPEKIEQLAKVAEGKALLDGRSASAHFREELSALIDQEQKSQNFGMNDDTVKNILDQQIARYVNGSRAPFSLTAANTRNETERAARLRQQRLQNERPDIIGSKGDTKLIKAASTSTLEAIIANPDPEEVRLGIVEKAQQELNDRRYPIEGSKSPSKLFSDLLHNKDFKDKANVINQLKRASVYSGLREQYDKFITDLTERQQKLLNKKDLSVTEENELGDITVMLKNAQNLQSDLPSWSPTIPGNTDVERYYQTNPVFKLF